MRVLLIVPPERTDFYNYLSALQNVEWILLWHEKPGQMTIDLKNLPLKFSRIIYWTQYRTPGELIKKLKPDRILFYELIDLRQIALIVKASAEKVPTIYLEHGAAGDKLTSISRWKNHTFQNHKLPYLIKRFSNSFFDVVKSKYFYFSVKNGFRSLGSYFKYFCLPFKMLIDPPNKVLAHTRFRERVPQKSIVFNEVNFEEYQHYTGISSEEAEFTGVPFFDKYYRPNPVIKNYVVYIDHPYLEENLLDWTQDYHRKVAQTLMNFAQKRNIELYIKLHPRSNIDVWKSYVSNNNLIKILQVGDFTQLYLEAKILFGFSSSLITGFLCSKKNVVLLAWHPEPQIFGVDFSQTGLCHLSYSIDELDKNYDDWVNNNLTMKDETAYHNFLRKFNFPFDGKATERVFAIIKEMDK